MEEWNVGMMFLEGELVVFHVPDGCNNLLSIPEFQNSTIPPLCRNLQHPQKSSDFGGLTAAP